MNKEIFELSFVMKRARRRYAIRIFLICLLIFISINLLFKYVVNPVKNTTVSMEPNVKRNTMLFVTPIYGTVHRGDVILIDSGIRTEVGRFQKIVDMVCGFFTLQKVMPFSDSGKMKEASFIRRVVALPGDTVYMKDFILYVKPAGGRHFLTEFELTETPYSIDIMIPPNEWDISLGVQGMISELKLGENEMFVLCDNRLSSADSRLWGSVKEKDVKGRVLFCYFPLNAFRLF